MNEEESDCKFRVFYFCLCWFFHMVSLSLFLYFSFLLLFFPLPVFTLTEEAVTFLGQTATSSIWKKEGWIYLICGYYNKVSAIYIVKGILSSKPFAFLRKNKVKKVCCTTFYHSPIPPKSHYQNPIFTLSHLLIYSTCYSKTKCI